MDKDRVANLPTIQVGDRVLIRQWKDMENEFGQNYAGDIDCRHVFTREMEPLCGEWLEVVHIFRDLPSHDQPDLIYLIGEVGSTNAGNYHFSIDMIENVSRYGENIEDIGIVGEADFSKLLQIT